MGNLKSNKTEEEWDKLEKEAMEAAMKDMTDEKFIRIGVANGMNKELATKLIKKNEQ